MLIILFWLLLGIIFYSYFGYPLLLNILAKAWKKNFKKDDIYPNVSLIIAAYNEEKSIEAKIKNSLSLDYPREKIEISAFPGITFLASSTISSSITWH